MGLRTVYMSDAIKLYIEDLPLSLNIRAYSKTIVYIHILGIRMVVWLLCCIVHIGTDQEHSY